MDKETTQTTPLSPLIESVLFYTGEEMTIKDLSDLFEETEECIREALEELKFNLEGRGVVLGLQKNQVYLGTHPDAHKYIQQVITKELSGDLTDPLLETLTVVLYQSPIPKTQIDYIRGVNTTTALRHLMARGLIERTQKGAQNFYTPTQEALRLLGVKNLSELPEFEEVKERLDNTLSTFEQSQEDE